MEGNEVCNGDRCVSCQSKIHGDGSISLRVDIKTNSNRSELPNDFPKVPEEQGKLKEPSVREIEKPQVKDVDNLVVQPTLTFQPDSATSRRKTTDLERKGRLRLPLYPEDSIQLSPEGEVNSGGYIPRREASRYISTALHRP